MDLDSKKLGAPASLTRVPMGIITPSKIRIIKGELVEIEDLGIQKTKFGNIPQIEFTFEIEELDENGAKRKVTRLFHRNMYTKSALSMSLKSWVKNPTAKEIRIGYESLWSLIGRRARLKVQPVYNDYGLAYYKILKIMKPVTPRAKPGSEEVVLCQ